MPRLFVAIELAAALTAELVAIQPPLAPGIRLVDPGQMHLTLHFIGEADVERMGAALAAIEADAFSLVVEGVGQFAAADGAVTLWAGVRESVELLKFHATIGQALAAQGFRPDARKYFPHVSLAHCGPEVPAETLRSFLVRHRAFSLPAVPIVVFRLYSSAFVGDVPVYQREELFSLRVAKRGGLGGDAHGFDT